MPLFTSRSITWYTIVYVWLASNHSTAPTASPPNVVFTIITTRNITVTWDTITCIERNGMITSYTVEFGPSGNTTIRTGVTELTFTANGLTPFTNYTLRVAGVNSVNTGIYSDIITTTTNEESKYVYVCLIM